MAAAVALAVQTRLAVLSPVHSEMHPIPSVQEAVPGSSASVLPAVGEVHLASLGPSPVLGWVLVAAPAARQALRSAYSLPLRDEGDCFSWD